MCVLCRVERSLATLAEGGASRFDEMVSANQRKYYLLGGKGGVGKTSCAASLAVKFASHGNPTIVVSTDPAHSLSDSFSQVSHSPSDLALNVFCYQLISSLFFGIQDLSGGVLKPVQGVDSPLLALEVININQLTHTPWYIAYVTEFLLKTDNTGENEGRD